MYLRFVISAILLLARPGSSLPIARQMITPAPRIRLFCHEHGPPTAPETVALLHGLPLSGRMFDAIGDGLSAAGIRGLAIDLRGFGKSAGIPGPFDFDVWADDLLDLFQSQELGRVTLVGYSFGGAVAMHYLVRHAGAHVARLGLLAATGPCMALHPDNPAGLPPEALTGWAEIARTDIGQLVTEVGNLLFHAEPPPGARDRIREQGLLASREAAGRGLEELRDRDLCASVRGITVPTLICQGVHDQILPFALGAELQHNLIPNSRIVRLEHSGHGLFVEEPDRLATELIAFIRQGLASDAT